MAKIKLLRDICENKHLQDNLVAELLKKDQNSQDNIQNEIIGILQATRQLSDLGLSIYRWSRLALISITNMNPVAGKLMTESLRLSLALGLLQGIGSQLTQVFSFFYQGIDLYYYRKGYIGTQQFIANTSSNVFGVIGAALLLAELSNPYGWALLVVSTAISARSLFYVSSVTYGQTIKVFLDSLISHHDDNITAPYWLQKQIYQQYLKIQSIKFSDPNYDHKSFYSTCRELDQKIQDNRVEICLIDNNVVAQNVAKIIIKVIKEQYWQIIIQYHDKELEKTQTVQYIQSMKGISGIIKSYFNRYKIDKSTEDICDTIDSLIKKIQEEIQNSENNKQKFKPSTNQQCIKYIETMKEFIQQFENNIEKYKKEQFDEFADGSLRTDKRFDITCNAYKNISIYKQNIQVQQDLVDILELDSTKKIFVPKNKIMDDWIKNNIFNFEVAEEDLQEFFLINMFVENRYITLTMGQEQASLMSQKMQDIINTPIEWQQDLFPLAIQSTKEEYLDKIINLKKETQGMLQDSDTKERLLLFYDAVQSLKKLK